MREKLWTWLGLSLFLHASCGQESADRSPGADTRADGGAMHDDADAGGKPQVGGDGGGHTREDAATPPEEEQTTGSYEAEEAFHGGTATFADALPGFSGRGYVEGLGSAGAKLTFAVNAAADAETTVRLHYQRSGADKTLALYLNGAVMTEVTLAPGEPFVTHEQTVRLRRGLNTLSFVDPTGDGGTLSVDKLAISNEAPRPVRGAIVPFRELEAEDMQHNGTPVGPDSTVGTVAAHASGRRAVMLDAEGKYVEWAHTEPSNALTIRYAIPDAPAGGGTTGTISLYVGGEKRKVLALSSRDAWLYGGYPFNNDPSQGGMLRPFSEGRFLVGDIAQGQTVRLQRDAGDAEVTVDLVDVELAPAPYPRPLGAISITEHGAVAGDDGDDAGAVRAAIAAAKAANKTVWVPEGEFVLAERVDLDHVTLRGAGPWHTSFHGKDGKGGFNGTGDAVQLLDFAMIGDMDRRDDGAYHAGIVGSLGAGSLVQNLWMQSTKVGIWLVQTRAAHVVGTLIRDTYADGVNLNIDVSHTRVEHVHARNAGDDAFAIWAVGNSEQNLFKSLTARTPYHASGIAVYGGTGHGVEDCDVADTVRNGAGIHVGTRHNPSPFTGTTTIQRNSVRRASSLDTPNSSSFGALWLFADTKPMDAPMVVRDLDVSDSTYDAIYFSGGHAIHQVVLDRVKVTGAGGYGIHVTTAGTGMFSDVDVTGASAGAAQVAGDFVLTRGDGNDGW
jgi:hypothetical protein